ncbi:MATH domain and coiled-coil domain-containing protein At3g58410-like [Raphanus sativus]|uniref:MATH domain and coiled-coil domain-containing protein At3g58410-like n=1 Tax=Raphanus sativus TaxID=3726 RepID=A0A6J0K7U0_RAPSA|nr:MATH domain and coiled-coil domain-containing protein At3g58410-like [Raphanus sativus]
MAEQVGHKFAWVIKEFSSLREKFYSPTVQIGDCKWRLSVYPKGIPVSDHLSLFLEFADVKSLPFGWRRLIKFRLTIAKQVSEGPSVLKKSHRWFDQKKPLWGFPTMIPLAKIHDKNEGFLVNDELIIVAEVDVLQVVGSSEKPEETNPPSQVESVSSIQDSVVEFRARNQYLKTACTNVLLSFTQTLCQTPQELSLDDMVEAEKVLAYMKDTGLEVEWLVKKLNEVKEKKKSSLVK